MGTVWTRRFVDFLLFLVVVAVLVLLAREGNAIAEGKIHMVSYAASSENYTIYPLGGMEAFWQLQAGSVRIDDHAWLRALQALARLAQYGFIAAILWQMRGLLARIGEGMVFTNENIAALKKIGWLLLAAAVLSVATAIFVLFVIINVIPPVEGRAIHPSLSWRKAGIENIWLEYSPPIMPIFFAMIAFITAAAFRSGQQYREDSESVV